MKQWLQFIAIILLMGSTLFFWNKSREIQSISDDNLLAMSDSIKYQKNKYGQEVASKLAIQMTVDQLKYENDTLKEAFKKFKKPIVIIKSGQVSTIPPVNISFVEPINCDFTRYLEKETEHFVFKGKVDSLGFQIDKLRIFNQQTIVTGWKKQGFFKPSLLTTEITNSNPYVKQTSIKPIVIHYPKKIYEKWYVTIPVGIAVGLLLK